MLNDEIIQSNNTSFFINSLIKQDASLDESTRVAFLYFVHALWCVFMCFEILIKCFFIR